MAFATEKNFEYFLDNDFSKYADGEWVAIYNNEVISHGVKLKKVMEKAKSKVSLSKVLISKVKKTPSFL